MSPAQPDSQTRADHEDWEMVSRHSSWGDAGLGDGLGSPVLSSKQGKDWDRSMLVETRGQKERRQASVRFQVHYITSGCAVHRHNWRPRESWEITFYIPLQWQGWVLSRLCVPAGRHGGGRKFVVVENGEVTRWEECSNRFLETGHEDKVVHRWWGFTESL